jgi:hypothetical protein
MKGFRASGFFLFNRTMPHGISFVMVSSQYLQKSDRDTARYIKGSGHPASLQERPQSGVSVFPTFVSLAPLSP